MVNVNDTMKPEEFWSTVGKTQFMDNTPMFPDLWAFMTTLLCLPHSSATVEKVFSAVNRMKKNLENRFSTETMIGLLQTKQLFREASLQQWFQGDTVLIGKHGNWKQILKLWNSIQSIRGSICFMCRLTVLYIMQYIFYFSYYRCMVQHKTWKSYSMSFQLC